MEERKSHLHMMGGLFLSSLVNPTMLYRIIIWEIGRK